jgi:hypothetical protein
VLHRRALRQSVRTWTLVSSAAARDFWDLRVHMLALEPNSRESAFANARAAVKSVVQPSPCSGQPGGSSHAGAFSESPLGGPRSRLDRPAAIVRRNTSTASGETRIAFATRTWCNSRRSQRPYTVAAETPSLAATCLTVRSGPIRIGPAVGVRTTGGPKSLGSVGNGWTAWTRCSCPSCKHCEGGLSFPGSHPRPVLAPSFTRRSLAARESVSIKIAAGARDSREVHSRPF